MNRTSSAVRVKSIHVKGLFGMYDHDVVLNESERMTVVHGPNGVGKTVLFKLAQDLLAGAGVDLLKYPFRECKVEFTNAATLIASRNDKDGTVQVSSHLGQATVDVSINAKSFSKWAHRLEQRLPIHQIGPDSWIDPETDEKLNSYEVISRYGGRINDEFDGPLEGSLHKWRKSQNYIPKIHLIEAQRLIRLRNVAPRHYRDSEAQAVRDTVMEYSQQLKKEIEATSTEYGRQAQKLDRTFPHRMLQQGAAPADAKQIEQDLQGIESKQDIYRQLGLIEEDLPPLQGLDQLESDPVKLALMTLYVTDMKAKLDVLDNLAQRVSLLLGQINEKFTDKKLLISAKHELAVETSHGDEIPVSALSSGEQHQIVLAYDMLFRIEANSLVMIDEPELSLHVNWQERFLSDLESVIGVANFDALIATHSPYIINGRNELVVSLSAKDRSRRA
jgi:ABC-type transport system involved in cytochrome c biogenesis ATPase subunit